MLTEEQSSDFRDAGSDLKHLAAQKKRRNVRRQLNLPLLLISLAVVAVLVLAGKYWYGHQKLQLASVFLERAEKLEAEEKWPEALTYLQRYLWIKPDDFDKRLQMVDVYEKSVTTPRDKSRLTAMLYEAIGRAPERIDLRLRLAENLLDLRAFTRAGVEARAAENLSEAGSPEKAQAKRLIAFSLFHRARDFTSAQENKPSAQQNGSTDKQWAQQTEGVSLGVAANALADSLKDFPSDIDLVQVTAEFYRRHQSSLNSSSLNAAEYADGVIEHLLQMKGDDPDALLAVYHYRSRYKLPNADQHLAKALEIDPDHHKGLLYAAEAAARKASSPQELLENSRGTLQKAILANPKDRQAYLKLSHLLAQTGDTQGCIEVLSEGKQHVGADDMAIGKALISKLFETNALEKAEVALNDLESAMQPKLLHLTGSTRRETENLLRVLHGKLSLSKGDLRRALVEFKGVAAATEQETSSTLTYSGIESRRLLGELTEKLQYWDMAASHWSSLAIDAPSFGEAHRRAALAYLKTRQPSKAIVHLERYLKPTPPANWVPQENMWLALLQSHLQIQLRRSSYSQNWAEFLETLEQVKERLPERWEIHFAEADYLNASATPESREKAYALFKSAEKQHSTQAAFWRNLVQGYSNLEKPEDAERAFKKYTELVSDPTKQAILRVNLLVRNKKFAEADKELVELLSSSTPKLQQKIQTQRLRLMLSDNQLDKAKKLLEELLSKRQKDPQLLSIGIETMLSAGDFATAEKWEKQLRDLDNLPDDFLWQHFRARRLLKQYESLNETERVQLGQLISTLRSSRPGWYNVVGLAARYAELRGDSRQAIDQYELAIKLGDDSTTMLQRLVLLLNNEGRFSDADSYLNRLSVKQGDSLQVESLEINSAVRNNQVQDAVELARKAVDRHPDDPQRRVWLASLLSLDDQAETAESVYRESLKKFPQDLRLWNGLFSLLIKNQQRDKASVVLETLSQNFKTDPAKQHFVLAQGYLKLGNQERAADECQLALQQDADNVTCRLLYAKLLMSTDTPGAETQLQEILKRDADNGEAKRQLASIWTASGRPADVERALELVNTIKGESALESQASNRLRAMMLARQGRSQQERRENIAAARRIIEEQLARSNAPADVDRVLLATIYETESLLLDDSSALQACREQWQSLIDRPEPLTQYQIQYIDFLFRQLSRTQEDSAQPRAWRNLREIFLAEAESRVAELADSLTENSNTALLTQAISYQIRLKKVQGDLDAASQILDDYAENTLPKVEARIGKARSYLGIGNLYSSIEQHQQAAEWYRKLSEVAPQTYILLVRELAAQGQLDQAIDVCLTAQKNNQDTTTNVAAILAQLLCSADQESHADERVNPIIDAALKDHKDDVDLLLAVAVLKVTKGREADAIHHFQRVLQLAPEHPLALNNLATLLAEQPNQLSEALNYIEQAIKISGRQSALLDTLGTIQIRMGEFPAAIASLEEAVAIGNSDARFQFHLAVAYHKAGQAAEARNALRRARRSGLEKMILTRGDQKLLKDLELQIDSNNS